MASKKAQQQQQQQPDPERQLMIKTKACQRLIKEVAYYKKEVQENESQLQMMKADPMKTEFDVKKFVEVLDESRMMIPDSKRRLDDALHDLEDFVLSQQQQPQQQQQQQNSSSGWYATAKSILDEHFHNNNISNKGESSNGIGGDDIVVAGEETNVEDLKEGEEF